MIIATELLGLIGRRRFIAKVRTETARQGLYTIEALAQGGITVFEISLAIPGAEELLRHFSGNAAIFVGAGGVLDARQAHEAARAGATFIASPIVAPEVVQVCTELHVACILGALTPTEIIAAQRAGADLVNIFPISAVGGSAYLRSLYRQFQTLNIMISGGITLENAFEYLAMPVRALGLSSTITPRDIIERGDWNMLTHLARQFISATQNSEFAQSHPGASAIPPPAPLLDTARAPVFVAPGASHPPASGYSPYSSYDELLEHPQAMPALGFDRSSPSYPGVANTPAASYPGTPSRPMPPGTSPSPPSTTPRPPSSRPGAPSRPPEPDPFKPWDSKPAGEDWIN